MKTLAIIGASSRIGIETIKLALHEDIKLHLFLRDKNKLNHLNLPSDRVAFFEGNAADSKAVAAALAGADMAFVSLEGQMEAFAQAALAAMAQTDVKRLVFVTSMGVLDEVPDPFGAWIKAHMSGYLAPYIKAMHLIEASDADYTILRPGELTNEPGSLYETTGRNEMFKGRYVTRQAIGALALDIFRNPALFSRDNIGVNRPV